MKTIIAGTDFTPSSINACNYAAMLAQKLNCKLVIFNLFEAPVVHSNMGLFGISYTSERINSENKANKQIARLRALFPGLKIDLFVTGGAFDEELKVFTAKHRVMLAVMGLESKTRITKFVYGSHGVNIAGKIKAPVIIVPEKYKQHKMSNILLAVDNGEKLQESQLASLNQVISLAKANIHLLHVRTPDELFMSEPSSLKLNGLKHEVEVRKGKDLENCLKKYCAEKGTDLVAIVSRRHSALYNFFSESYTKKIAFATKVPVMAIHE